MNKSKGKKLKETQSFLECIKHFDAKIDRAKQDLKDHNWKIFKIVIGIILVVLTITGWQIYSRTQSLIEERLDEEFSAENIKLLIEETAKKHTEDKVVSIIQGKVESAIDPFSKEIQAIVKEANLQLKGLTSIIELRGAANLGSRQAYESLVEIGSGDSVFALAARAEALAIKQDLSFYLQQIKGSHLNISVDQNGKEVSAKDLTTAELFAYVEQQTTPVQHRFYLLFDIIEKPKEEIFSESLRILKESQYLPAIIATNGVLIHLLGPQADAFDFDAWISILEKR